MRFAVVAVKRVDHINDQSNNRTTTPMGTDLEHEIRDLAYHIWLTAGNDFSRQALDFWVMAEQMVIEMAADSARRVSTTVALAFENAAAWPSALRALYLYRTRELAHGMWSASAEQRDRSLDYWLAAENHLRLLTESAARTAGTTLGKEEALVKIFETFSPTNYLEQIRKAAYQLWESAGSQYGSALDFWLAAEQKVLDSLITSGPATVTEDTKRPERPKRNPRQRQRQPMEK